MENKQTLLKALWTSFRSNGLTEEEIKDILKAHGVESTKELNDEQMLEIIKSIRTNKQKKEKDEWVLWCKRCMAVVAEYVRAKGYKESSSYIKQIITTSQRTIRFDKLTVNQLKRCYNQFKNYNDGTNNSAKTEATGDR